MAKYEFESKKHNLNLEQFNYIAFEDGDNYLRLNWIYKDKFKGNVPGIVDLFKYDKEIQSENIPVCGLYLYYIITEGNELILDYLCYEKGFCGQEVKIELNKKEKKLFQKILTNYNL